MQIKFAISVDSSAQTKEVKLTLSVLKNYRPANTTISLSQNTTIFYRHEG